MNINQFLFMVESEGHDELVSTRYAQITAVCNEFKQMYDQGATKNQLNASIQQVLTKHGIDGRTLNASEKYRIQNCI